VLKSTLGDVVNLSGGGVCVRCKGKPKVGAGQILQLTLQSAEQRIRVTARVVRVSRRGFWAYEVGLSFVDPKPGLASVLQNFAQFGFVTLSDVAAAGKAQEQPTPEAADPKAEAPNEADRKHILRAVMEMPNPYEQLQITPDATEEQVKAAYRRIARTCHPDVSRDPESAARFIACTQAYELLADPAKRRLYDEAVAKRPAA
jgi:hypothetical protein